MWCGQRGDVFVSAQWTGPRRHWRHRATAQYRSTERFHTDAESAPCSELLKGPGRERPEKNASCASSCSQRSEIGSQKSEEDYWNVIRNCDAMDCQRHNSRV